MAEKLEIRVRESLQGDRRIVSLAFHPTEPFVIAGLASGDLCLCACRTDAISAQVEHERANRCFEGDAKIAAAADPASRFPYVGAVAPAAGWRLLRVLEVPLRRGASGAAQEIIQHAHFMTGRESDLVQDLALPDVATASGKDGLLGRARHLAVLVTNLNSVLVVDVMQNKLLRYWNAASGQCWACDKATGQLAAVDGVKEIHKSSPFHASQFITQVGTFGALLFCVIAKRADVEACNQRFHSKTAHLRESLYENLRALPQPSGHPPKESSLDFPSRIPGSGVMGVAAMEAASRAPELLYTNIQNHYLFVCHLGLSQPFAKPHKSHLAPGKGAYIITPKGSSNKLPLAFIRVHPLAPIVMTVTANAVRVYGIQGGVKATPYAVLQKPVDFDESAQPDLSPQMLLGPAQPLKYDTSLPPTWILDADFLPTAVVATSTATATCLTLENLSLALLTSRRLSIVDCSFSSEDKRIRSHTGAVESGARGPGAAAVCYAPRERAYITPATGGLCFQRLHAWLSSPSTVLVQQSNRQIVEYTEDDVLPLASRLLTMRSVRSLPQRCGYGWYLAPVSKAAISKTATTNTTAATTTSCYVSRSLRLPTWGLQDRLPLDVNGVSALPSTSSPLSAAGMNPLVDACGVHRLVFSRPTHVAAWGQTCFAGSASEASDYHIASVLADTSSIDTKSINFTIALSQNDARTQTSSSSSSTSAPTSPGRVLTVTCSLASAPVSLVAFDHSFYFVGTRAQASNVFVVGGLVYMESTAAVKAPGATEDTKQDPSTASIVRTTRLRAALFCCPAAPDVVQKAVKAVAEAAAQGKGKAPNTAPASVAALLDTPLARYAGVYEVPVPSFPSLDGNDAEAGAEKELLSTSFQLTNDGQVVPCVWSLWAPSTGAKQLVLQRFSIAEDSAAPMWSAPQLVDIQNKAYQNPTQIFALPSVGGMRCTWPQEASLISQLFLYYEESNVLVLATVERGSRYVVSSSSYGRMLFASETSASDYGMGAGSDQNNNNNNGTSTGTADGELHLMPQAAVELPTWGGGDSGAGPLQLTATLSSDGSAVLVSAASRRHGFVIAEFPVIGRRTDAADGAGSPGSGVATLVKERILCSKPWSALETGGSRSASAEKEEAEAAASEAEEAADRHATSPEMVNLSPGQRAVFQSRRRTARAERSNPRGASWDESTAPVSLFQWIFLASGAEAISSVVPGGGGAVGGGGGGRGAAGRGGAETNVVPFVLVQRFRQLFAIHPSGHVTSLCPAINNCVPLGIRYSVSQPGDTSSTPATTTQADNGEDSEGDGGTASGAQGAQPAVPPLPLGRIGANAAAATQGIMALRVVVQYGDFAALLAHTERSRQRFTQSVFARHGAPQLTVEGADGVVVFVPGSQTKQQKPRHSSPRGPANGNAGSVVAAAAEAATTESHRRDVLHLMEQNSRREELAEKRRQVFSCVPAWVSEGGVAVNAGASSSSSPSWSIVQNMDITDPLRAAVVRMHATDVSRTITQLITSSVLLTASIRGTFAALNSELEESAAVITGPAQGEQVASLLGGDLPTAQVLATVPLSSVTVCLAHECRRAKAYDDALRRTAGAKSTARPPETEELRQSRLSLQRWWLLVMQSYVLVNALNDGERDRSEAAVHRVLGMAANPFVGPAGSGGGGSHTAEIVGEVLLYCPIVFQPSDLWAGVASGVSEGSQKGGGGGATGFLQSAVTHALALLGGSAKAGGGGGGGGAEATHWLQTTLASLSLDGGHWVTSVLLDRLYYNLKGLAEGRVATGGSSDALARQLAETAASLVQVMDNSSEVQTAAAVIEVAASTVATLRGSGYNVSGESRERMNAAVAVSVSRRKKVMGVATPRVLGGRGDADPLLGNGAEVGMSALLRKLDEKPPETPTSPATPAESSNPPSVQTDNKEPGKASANATAEAAAAATATATTAPQDVLLRPPSGLNAADELRAQPDTALLARLDRIRAVVYATHWRALYGLSAYSALCWQSGEQKGAGAAGVPLQLTCDPAKTAIPRPHVDENASTDIKKKKKSEAPQPSEPAHTTADDAEQAGRDGSSPGSAVPTRQTLAAEMEGAETGYAPPTPQQIQSMLANEEEAMRANYYDAFAPEASATNRPPETTGAASTQNPEDALEDFQRRIAAPPSVSTRNRSGVSGQTAPAEPLRAQDYFARMAGSGEGDSNVW